MAAPARAAGESAPNDAARMDLDRQPDGTVVLTLDGRWTVAAPGLAALRARAAEASDAAAGRVLTVRADGVAAWDSALVAFLLGLAERCAANGAALELSGVPAGAERLMRLAVAVPERRRAAGAEQGVLARVGAWAVAVSRRGVAAVSVLGEAILALVAFARGRASYRRRDLTATLQEAGVEALPIVGLISLLMGLILAFIGAVQLEQFGAAIYVADLVGIAATREIAAVMTAIVLAGRTGAAFAAQLGTMQGNEEIDALATFGISPIEFLMLPRLVALSLMMPLLYVYGCFINLLGGWLVATTMLDLTSVAYINETRYAVTFADFAIGLVKSIVFGVVVAFTGCLRGLQAGRSAAAVGAAATSAVVSSIVMIILLDAVFAVLLNVLGI